MLVGNEDTAVQEENTKLDQAVSRGKHNEKSIFKLFKLAYYSVYAIFPTHAFLAVTIPQSEAVTSDLARISGIGGAAYPSALTSMP